MILHALHSPYHYFFFSMWWMFGKIQPSVTNLLKKDDNRNEFIGN
jgi:hypothetical protein